MPISSGTRLGPYEVVAPLGAGGMGEVYKARDTRLGREVAVKVLPASFSADPDRLQRFEQEARAAAALNHPNILALYDIGTHDAAPYLVTELLEGVTLREKVNAGPLAVRKALDYGVQIAHGLAAAHGKGIVHRDLKPENLFITDDGRAKILDFGLAKLLQAEPVAGTATALPTTPPQTMAGVVLGTIGYMSPEQVRGVAADHRSDIFAFGLVLYEMLSGRRAFSGETVIDTMTAILKEDPADLPLVERAIPPALARIVDRCLEKSPAARFQSADDLAFALEGLSSQSGTIEAPAPASPSRRGGTRLPWAATAFAVLVAVGAVAMAAYVYLRPVAAVQSVQFSIPLPDEWALSLSTVVPTSAVVAPLAVSPDGRRLAFVARNRDAVNRLWIRPLNALTAQELPGTDGATSPFWSPDSRFLAFFADGKLKKIDLSGGPPVIVCSAIDHRGGTWSRDNVILFSPALTGAPLMKVAAGGGVPTPVTTLQRGESGHVRPVFLPDGRHFIYTVTNGSMYIESLDSDERTVLFEKPDSSTAMYSLGHLLFMREATLMAQPFDLGRLRLTGEPVPIAEQIYMQGGPPVGHYTASDNGVLVYQTGEALIGQSLGWFDRTGKPGAIVGDRKTYSDLEMSGDSAWAVMTLLDLTQRTRDVWLVELARKAQRRLTVDPSDELAPIWSEDGRTVAFASRRRGHLDLYQKPADGSREEELILADEYEKTPLSWSHDGRFLLYRVASPAGGTLWALPMTGERKPFPFRQNRFNNAPATFSPDGRWVAYVSNESGAAQVYVSPFPGPGGQSQISTAGGTFPRWRDSKELIYLAGDGLLTAVAVNGSGPAFEVGPATPLFPVRPAGARAFYDVSPGGRQFLIHGTPGDLPALSAPMTVVTNWRAGLSR